MTKYLAQRLIDLRSLRFASQEISELRLDHVERRFDIGSLVVVLHVMSLIRHVVVKEPLPHGVLLLIVSLKACYALAAVRE